MSFPQTIIGLLHDSTANFDAISFCVENIANVQEFLPNERLVDEFV